MKSPSRPHASFGKQALLIAAPLVILSAFALYSLRRDKASIEQDARDGAQALAPELADQVRRNVEEDLKSFVLAWTLDEYAPVALAWPEGSSANTDAAPDAGTLGQHPQADIDFESLPQLQGRLLNGGIQSPVDYPRLPVPSEWANQLTPELSRIWTTAAQVLFQRKDGATVSGALAAMRAARLPEAAYAGAELNRLLLQAKQAGAAPDLPQRLTELAHKYPEACTDAGTPIGDLALIQALRCSTAGPLLDSLRRELFYRVIEHPSFLTPELIASAERQSSDPQRAYLARILKNLWLVQERTRAVLRSLLQHPMDPFKLTEIWLDAEGQPIFAQCQPVQPLDERRVRRPPGGSCAVLLVPGRVLEKAFINALAIARSQVPSYLTPVVHMGGRQWPAIPDSSHTDSVTGHVEMASCSSAISVRPDLPTYLRPGLEIEKELLYLAPPVDPRTRFKFAISLELTGPDLLYARYRQRLWLAAGFILCATAAAGLGLASAWRAFRRQLQLAEMTSNFVSSVSHELRAPLASVRLMAESLDQDRITEQAKRKDYFRLIVQECRRLSALVENVLDFSRIRQGRKRYEFEPVDLGALVRQTVKLMEPNAEERRVSLVLSEPTPAGDAPQPCWDGAAVQQALVNLIDNAIKHSPAGGTVDLRVELAKAATKPGICLTVEDQGQGIPPSEQERIFEPFYRLGSELRRETRGVGIGLSIVKHIAEAHGGRVRVESVAGQGSRFTLDLPLRMEPRMDADQRG